jgi:hypothetical protein
MRNLTPASRPSTAEAFAEAGALYKLLFHTFNST